MQVPTTSRKRIDPLTQVADVDSLSLAHSVYELRLDWEDGDVPARPLGKVRFEVLRQIATFAVPAVVLATAALIGGTQAALYASPVALLTGALLDYKLSRDIAARRREELKGAEGLYGCVRELCIRLNLKPEEITMRRIAKMEADYQAYVNGANARWAARRAVATQLAPNYEHHADAAMATGVAGAAAFAYADADYASHDYDFASANAFDSGSSLPDYNVNGTPMMEGHAVDVQGNSYGFTE